MADIAPIPASITGSARQQAEANRAALIDTIRAQQVQQETPFGTLRFEGDPLTADRRAISELSPSQQLQLEQRNAIAESLGIAGLQSAGQIRTDPFSFGGLPTAGSITGEDFGAQRSAVEEATLARQMRFLEPQFAESEEALRSRLVNQGFQEGTQGFERQLRDLRNQQGTQRQDAIDRSILAGGQEQSRLFGLDIARLGAQQGIRAGAAQEQLTERQLPFQELQGFLGATPISQAPQFQPFGVSAAAPDVIGASAAQQAAQTQAAALAQQGRSANLGAIAGIVGGLGGAFLGSESGSKAFSGLF